MTGHKRALAISALVLSAARKQPPRCLHDHRRSVALRRRRAGPAHPDEPALPRAGRRIQRSRVQQRRAWRPAHAARSPW